MVNRVRTPWQQTTLRQRLWGTSRTTSTCVGHAGYSVDISMVQLNRLVDSPGTARLNERRRHVGRTAALIGDYSLKEPDVVVGCIIGEACPGLNINDPGLFEKAIAQGVLDSNAAGISDGQHVSALMCAAAGLREDDNTLSDVAAQKMFPRMAESKDPATCMKNVRFYVFESQHYAQKFSECCRRNNAATDSGGVNGPNLLRPSLLASLALAPNQQAFKNLALAVDAHLRPHSKTLSKAALARLPSTVIGYWLAWLAGPNGRRRVSWAAPTYRPPCTQEHFATLTWRERNHLAGGFLDTALKASPTLVLADDAALVKDLVEGDCLLTPTSALLVNKACDAMRLAAVDLVTYVSNDPHLRQVLVLVISALAPFLRLTAIPTARQAEDDCLVVFFLACMRQAEGVGELCMTLTRAAVPDNVLGLCFPKVARFAGADQGVDLFFGGAKDWNPTDASVSLVATAVYGAVRDIISMAKAAKGLTAHRLTRNNCCNHELVGPPAVNALKSVVQSSLVDVIDYLHYVRAAASTKDVNPVAAWVTWRQVGADRDHPLAWDLTRYPRLRLDSDLGNSNGSLVTPYRFQRCRDNPSASGWATREDAEQGLSALASFVANYPVLRPTGGDDDLLTDDRELRRRYAVNKGPVDDLDAWLDAVASVRQSQWDILADTPRLYLRGPAVDVDLDGRPSLTEAIYHEFLNHLPQDDAHLNGVSFPIPVLFEPVFRLMARMTLQVLNLVVTKNATGTLVPAFRDDPHYDHLAWFMTIAETLDRDGCGDKDFEASSNSPSPSLEWRSTVPGRKT